MLARFTAFIKIRARAIVQCGGVFCAGGAANLCCTAVHIIADQPQTLMGRFFKTVRLAAPRCTFSFHSPNECPMGQCRLWIETSSVFLRGKIRKYETVSRIVLLPSLPSIVRSSLVLLTGCFFFHWLYATNAAASMTPPQNDCTSPVNRHPSARAKTTPAAMYNPFPFILPPFPRSFVLIITTLF